MTAARSQRGVALLTVLLLVAVMTVLVTVMLDDIRFALRRAGNAQALAQARWHALGAEQMALTQIERLARRDPGVTTLAGGWNGRAFLFPIDDGVIRASVAPKPTEAGPETPQPDPRDRSELAPNIAEQMRRAMSLSATRALTPEGEHHKAWEIQAAVAGVEPSSSLAARSGYHLANVARSVPSSTRVRVCSSRCAPRDDHCIC